MVFWNSTKQFPIMEYFSVRNVEDTSPHTSVSQEVINANINGSAKSR